MAIGGTPAPIDDLYGIPRRAFDVTVRSIGGTGTGKFLERMCGTPDVLREYYRHRSTRPLEEIYDELVALQRQAEAAETGGGGPPKDFGPKRLSADGTRFFRRPTWSVIGARRG